MISAAQISALVDKLVGAGMSSSRAKSLGAIIPRMAKDRQAASLVRDQAEALAAHPEGAAVVAEARRILAPGRAAGAVSHKYSPDFDPLTGV